MANNEEREGLDRSGEPPLIYSPNGAVQTGPVEAGGLFDLGRVWRLAVRPGDR